MVASFVIMAGKLIEPAHSQTYAASCTASLSSVPYSAHVAETDEGSFSGKRSLFFGVFFERCPIAI